MQEEAGVETPAGQDGGVWSGAGVIAVFMLTSSRGVEGSVEWTNKLTLFSTDHCPTVSSRTCLQSTPISLFPCPRFS